MGNVRATRRLATPVRRMPLFFVRHGEAEHNPFIVEGKQLGAETERGASVLREGRSILNPKLTEKGRTQAEGLRERLKNDRLMFDLLVTTPLARAIETAYIAFGDNTSKFLITPLGVETADPKLAGPQRGVSRDQLLKDYPFISSWDTTH